METYMGCHIATYLDFYPLKKVYFNKCILLTTACFACGSEARKMPVYSAFHSYRIIFGNFSGGYYGSG